MPPTSSRDVVQSRTTLMAHDRAHRTFDLVETACLIRGAIARTFRPMFPDTRFSVRVSRFAGGTAIAVKWTDGPTEVRVRALLEPFRAFEDSVDGPRVYRTTFYEGRPCRYASAYLTGSRLISEAFLAECIRAVADEPLSPEMPGVTPETVRYRMGWRRAVATDAVPSRSGAEAHLVDEVTALG